jgi:hypothetical protein
MAAAATNAGIAALKSRLLGLKCAASRQRNRIWHQPVNSDEHRAPDRNGPLNALKRP